MTYDQWKTRSPDDELYYGLPYTDTGECDCCGKWEVLTRCWPMGIETFACDACRGDGTSEENE